MLHQDLTAAVARLVSDPRDATSAVDAAIARLLEQYLGEDPFGGRDPELAALDAWLAATVGPRCALLAAPAGRGKSALLARWAASLAARSEIAVVYYPISVRYGTNRAAAVLAALADRVARLHGQTLLASADARERAAALADLLARPLADGRTMVVVLDGLDEAVGRDEAARWFSELPHSRLRVLVAARSRAGDTVDRGWLSELGWEGAGQALCLSLGGLDRNGLSDLVAQIGGRIAGGAVREAVVDRLQALTLGDPLLASLYVKALLPHGEQPAVLQIDDLSRLEPGLHAMLTACFDRWIEEQQALWGDGVAHREEAIRALLALSATAFGPLGAAFALAIAGPELRDREGLASAARLLARFVLGDGEAQGFTFSHPRLREYFLERMPDAERGAWQARFVAYGRRTAEALAAGTLPPQDASPYVVQYHAAHLAEARASTRDFAILLSEGWLRAWEWIDGTPAGFLDDARAIWQRARADGAAGLGIQLRAALTVSSMVSLAASVPDYLLLPCVEAGLVSPRLALVMTRQQSREAGRARCLVALTAHLPIADRPAVLAEALRTMRGLESPFDRAYGLGDMIDHVAPEEKLVVLGEMLAAVCAIQDESRRQGPLESAGEHLPPGLDAAPWRARIVAIARAIVDPVVRAQVLSMVITTVLPAPERTPLLQAEALAAVRLTIGNHWDGDCWRVVVECLSDDAPQLLAEAVELGCELDDEEARTGAIAALAGALPRRSTALWERLSEAQRTVVSGGERLDILEIMVPRAPRDRRAALLAEALAAARGLDEAELRATALTRMAALVPIDERPSVLAEALDAARAHAGDRDPLVLRMLEKTGADAPPEIIAGLLALARGIVADDARIFALIEAAAHVPPAERAAVLAEALAAARSMSTAQQVAYGLMNVGYAVDAADRAAVLEEAIAASRAIPSPNTRAYFLVIDLAACAAKHPETAHLPSRISNEELVSFESGVAGSWVFSDLVQYLPAEDRPSALARALAIDRRIRDHGRRARTLCALAAHLPLAERRALLDQALHALRSSHLDHTEALEALARRAAPDAPDLRADVLALARRPTSPDDRANTLAVVAACLPLDSRRALLEEALEELRTAKTSSNRFLVLRAIIDRLPGDAVDLLDQALSIAREIADVSDRAWALDCVAAHLSSPARRELFDEALATASAIDIPPGWSPAFKLGLELRVLLGRLDSLSPEERPSAVAEISCRASAVDSSYDRIRDLTSLAGCLSLPGERDARRERLLEALAVARTVPRVHCGASIVIVAKSLSASDADLLVDALDLLHTMDDVPARAEASAKMAQAIDGTFPSEARALAGEALILLPELKAGRDDILGIAAVILPFWSPVCQARGLDEIEQLSAVLATCVRASREQALAFIEAALPLLARLGGTDVVRAAAQAIEDVTRWWP
jgi:hypothetical protein